MQQKLPKQDKETLTLTHEYNIMSKYIYNEYKL